MALPRCRLSTSPRALRTSRCIDIAHEDRAQSTVEAAFLLPTFLTLILLALQPVCLLYTRAVMESAAAETARLMTTTTAEDDDLKEFTRRRLAAVPNVSIFHAGGPLSWDIELGRAGAGGVSSVSVSGEVKPLPVIGAFAQAMGGTAEGGYVELKVDVSYQSRPEWLEGDYDSWIAAWD
ncbi:MAG: pilus assembly protein [Collinsella sp.]|nr:pilus assembly protein [Collinsella sp.]